MLELLLDCIGIYNFIEGGIVCFFSNADKYYTSEKNVIFALDELDKVLKKLGNYNKTFLEPSAGNGAFLNALEKRKKKYKAYDLYPEGNYKILKKDYLKLRLKRKYITIGNPPFGNRGNLALDFINHSTNHSDVIGFILPNTFKKYSIQKRVNKDYKLVFSENLVDNFFNLNGRNIEIKSCFQIWVKKELDQEDMLEDQRIKKAPDLKHKDFEMFLHNNTKQTLKFFNKKKYKWDFAVHRQGYYDYNKFIEKEEDLKNNRQYIFFKAKNKKVLKKLKELNFNKLSNLNTVTPGFGKADIVKFYKENL